MRCKNHYTDLSSIVGVCASCLRERLFYLVTTQSQTLTLTLDEDRYRNLDTHPVFPRSVSPYITRRKSDISGSSTTNLCNSRTDQRFFSTPQLGPTHTNNNNNNNNNEKKKKKHSFARFNLLSKLFRSRKQKESVSDSDPRFSVSNSRESYGGDSYHTSTSAMSSPFRLNNIRSSSRNKHPVYFSESSTGNVNRKQYCSDRGMSPVRLSNCVEDEFHDVSSGYETCESRKQTPWRTPAHSAAARRGGGGLMFCLSPLVRTSPCRNWNQKGGLPADGGDNRGPVMAHLSNTKSFCANRSRKLADFGRFNSNR